MQIALCLWHVWQIHISNFWPQRNVRRIMHAPNNAAQYWMAHCYEVMTLPHQLSTLLTLIPSILAGNALQRSPVTVLQWNCLQWHSALSDTLGRSQMKSFSNRDIWIQWHYITCCSRDWFMWLEWHLLTVTLFPGLEGVTLSRDICIPVLCHTMPGNRDSRLSLQIES